MSCLTDFFMKEQKKLKVLLVASEFAPGMIPFAATIINTLARDVRFDVHCICVNSKNKSYLGLVEQKANPIYIEYPSSKVVKMIYKVWPFKVISEINKVRKVYNPDVVHFLTGDFTLAFYVRCYKDAKMFYTVHDLHPHEVKLDTLLEKIIFKYVVWGYRKCRESIDNLTTSSLTQLKELKQLYVNKKCEYTPFPSLVISSIMHGTKTPVELEHIDDYILFFGSVNSYKGVDMLIRAFESSKICANYKMVVAGKGLDYPIKSSNIIRLNRFIDDDEIAQLFKKAKLVVYPYVTATMSGVLSLAYFFNKLVLASDIPFFKEYATKSVYFFKAGDVDDLRAHIEDMVENVDTSHIDNTGYERLFGEKALIDSYWKLYTE